MSIAGNPDRSPKRSMTAFAALRYGFYFVAVVALLAIGLVWYRLGTPRISSFQDDITTVDGAPDFRINSDLVGNLPISGKTQTSYRLGRVEILAYGSVQSVQNDMSVVLAMPPAGMNLPWHYHDQFHDTYLLAGIPFVEQFAYYVLETRFGPLLSTHVTLKFGENFKNCLTFTSRSASDPFYLTGWYCTQQNDRRPDALRPEAIACALDKLSVGRKIPNDALRLLSDRAKLAPSCSARRTKENGNPL